MSRHNFKPQSGFTLIELMISLVLGLLISAAVIQVYIISARTATVQQSASEVQDSSIFALQAVENHVRLANLGNPITSINDKTANGGIIITNENFNGYKDYATNVFTASAGQAVTGNNPVAWSGISNTNEQSDQLTIKYKNITPNIIYDCEGNAIPVNDTNWVLERYFLRLNNGSNANNSGAQDLILACDAGHIRADGYLINFANQSQVIAPNVDQFKVLLGVQIDVANVTYISPKTYLELTDKPPITTIKLGYIIRSTTPLLTDADKTSFTVLGSPQTLKTDATRSKFYRRSYESTILLRNARVMNVVATAPKFATPTTTK